MQSPIKLQKRCDEFNARHPAGSEVRYHPIAGKPEYLPTRILRRARVLSAGTPLAVVWVEGVSGCVALDAIRFPPRGAAA